MNTPSATTESLLRDLGAVLPAAALVHDEAARLLRSQDISGPGAVAAVVIRPGSLAELQRALATLAAAGVPALAYGGGMSYTGGLQPPEPGWAVIDMGRMNRVLEINREDMYVTVECGCTWQRLHEALAGSGLRTPYWGPLSGSRATVGGSLSQNAIFWGSGSHGSAADSLLSLDVALADGTAVTTGAAAQRNGSPFFRYHGPDLGGLFCGDSGTLGIKAHATLRLVPAAAARECLSFHFAHAVGALAAMSDIARAGLASECFGFDPVLQGQRTKRASLGADVKALAGVARATMAERSMGAAVKASVGIALAGRRFLDEAGYSVHAIVEDRSEAAAQARAQALRDSCGSHGGREVANSVPQLARATPFGPLNAMLGPEGERWLPVHGLFPHSKFLPAFAAAEALFTKHRARSEELGIVTGYLFATVASHCAVLEPVFFWPDERLAVHEDAVEAAHLARLPRHPANEEARAVVGELRAELVAAFDKLGAAHLQLGRTYDYRARLKPEAAALVTAVKQAVDPARQLNPGALGLD